MSTLPPKPLASSIPWEKPPLKIPRVHSLPEAPTLPPKPTPKPPSQPSEQSQENRKIRRKRERATQREKSSSSSCLDVQYSKDKPEHSREMDKPKEKATQNRASQDPQSSRSANPTFDHQDDFIPFVFSRPSSPLSEDEERGSRRGDGESGRSHGKKRERDITPARNTRDGDKERRKEKSRGVSPPVREWDRGKGKGRGGDSDRERDADGRRGGNRDKNRNGRQKYDMVFDHSDGYANERQTRRKAPWVDNVNWHSCSNVAEMLHREVEAFVKYLSPTPVEDEIRGLIIDLISKAVTKSFPDAKILPFGSYETKLYLPHGDIDLVIMSDSMAYSHSRNVLPALANALKRAQIASRVSIIAKAKVPIVKFVTTHGNFNVDISINHGNGVTAGKVVNGFLKNLHAGGQGMALRSLIMVIKSFLSQRNMNEVYSGGLGSYSIVCMAVSFLQMHPKIRRGEIDPEKNLGVLVVEFFELYGRYFNFEETGISIRDGGTYYNKRKRGWLNPNKRFLLSIEDPIDTSNDISSGSYNISKVRTTLAGAHEILTTTAYLRANMIRAQRDRQHARLGDDYRPEDLSILIKVLGVTQETINHRRMVQELYDQRTLHDLLGVKTKIVPVVSDTKTDNAEINGHRKPPSKSKSRAAASVEMAWREADTAPESYDVRRPSREVRERDKEEEQGRYDIEKPPPRKRRKTKDYDDHAEYVVDEDETSERIANSVDSLDEEETSYDIEHSEHVPGEKKRSYWLSKAIALGGGIDSD